MTNTHWLLVFFLKVTYLSLSGLLLFTWKIGQCESGYCFSAGRAHLPSASIELLQRTAYCAIGEYANEGVLRVNAACFDKFSECYRLGLPQSVDFLVGRRTSCVTAAGAVQPLAMKKQKLKDGETPSRSRFQHRGGGCGSPEERGDTRPTRLRVIVALY